MREIWFRGKRADNGKWVYGFYEKYADRTLISFDSGRLNSGGYPIRESHEVITETVGKYTGLTDENGKKIFEGDICKHRLIYSGDFIISVVTYTDGCSLAMADKNSGINLTENLEVIGNIHDNPELLGGAE